MHTSSEKRKIPSLVDLCVEKAIENVKYIGNVGSTDDHLLERILPHCTLDQLTHIENRTKGRDLSPVTNKLWKKFYEIRFGTQKTDQAIERMKQEKMVSKWRELYEGELRGMKERQEKCIERVKQLYKEEDAKKQSRRIQLCTKVPPSSKKRSLSGGGGGAYNNIAKTKSSLLKKSKLDFINSVEVKNLAAMKTTKVRKPMQGRF